MSNDSPSVNVDPRKVQEWCTEFAELYHEVDKQRSPEELWIATMAHCSAMGEGIRRANYSEIVESAAHAFCWMCSYVNLCNNTNDLIFRFDHSLCDMVYLKFPKQCGYCETVPCSCNPAKMDAKKDKSAKYERLYNIAKRDMPINYSLSDWMEAVFKELYGGRIHMMTLESIGFHFLEEAGEEMMAVRQLIQFRNVLGANIDGIDESFLRKIFSMSELISEYKKCLNDPTLKKDPSGNKPIIDYTSLNPVQIKTRIVNAKMDFVIELAPIQA